MANILIINRIEEGLFTHTLTADGETQTAIDNAPNLTSFWINGVRVMDFKTRNGAPLVRNQRILPSEITITDSFGSTPPQTGFTNDVQVWNALGALGYFQGFSGGSGEGGVDSFINLTDVNPNLYLGFEGMVYVVNETATGLEPVIFYNYNKLTQLDDVEIDSLVPSDTGKYVAVSMVDGEPKFTLVTLPNSGNDLPNGFTNLGTQSLVDGEYTATVGYEWNYQNIHYGLVDDFTATINPAGEGNSRIDVIHTLPGTNEFAKTEGVVSAGQNTAVKPSIPVGALEVTILSIYEDSISEPTDPITGEQFITKSSYGWTQSNISGENTTIIYQSDANAFELINPALVSIDSVSVSIEDSYNGQQVWILNKTGNSITLNNNASGGLATFLPFIFPEGQDMTIANNGLVRFKRKDNEMLFESYSIAGLGDFIPRSGTIEGQPITGPLEFEPYTETGLFSKDNDSDISFTLDLGSDLDGSGSGFRREDSGASSSLLMTSSGTYLNSNNPDYQGIVGNQYFDKQGNPNAFAQMQDIEDSVPSLDELSGYTTDNQIVLTGSAYPALDVPNTGIRAMGVVADTINALTLFQMGDSGGFQVTNESGLMNLNKKIVYKSAVPTTFSSRELPDANWVNAGLALKANLSGGNNYTGDQSVNGNLNVSGINQANFFRAYRPTQSTSSGFQFFTGGIMDWFIGEGALGATKDFTIYDYIGNKIPLQIKSITGLVGINNPDPTEQLDVNGNMKLSGVHILGKFTTGTEPALVIGAVYFNTTKDRLMIGRSDGWLAIDELKSPNGSKFKLNVSDTGVLTTTSA